jgi:hypothetical protein
LDEAERSGEELQIVWPLQVGSYGNNGNSNRDKVEKNGHSMELDDETAGRKDQLADCVTDWAALEALLWVQ